MLSTCDSTSCGQLKAFWLKLQRTEVPDAIERTWSGRANSKPRAGRHLAAMGERDAIWVMLVAAQNATWEWQRARRWAPRSGDLLTDEARSVLAAEISLRGAADAYRALRAALAGAPKFTQGWRATKLMARAVRNALTWQCVRLVGHGRRQPHFDALDQAFDGELRRDEALLSQMQNTYFRLVASSDPGPATFLSPPPPPALEADRS